MKFCVFFILMISSTSFAFKSGGGVSGGGNGFLTLDGKLLLADLVPANSFSKISSKKQQSSILNRFFFSKKRYVKKLFYPEPQFFDCAIRLFGQSNLKALEDLTWELQLVEPQLTEFHFNYNLDFKGMHEEQLNFPLSATYYYPHLSRYNQVSLAYYNDGELFIQKRFYEKLSAKDKCALSVHEGLRVLSSVYTSLSDENVILLTRFYMKDKLLKNEIDSVEMIKKYLLSNRIFESLSCNAPRRVSAGYAMLEAAWGVGIPRDKNGLFYTRRKTSFRIQPNYLKVYKTMKYQNEELKCFDFDVLKQEFIEKK